VKNNCKSIVNVVIVKKNMYPKMKLDIFPIFIQLITFEHYGKPKTVLKLVCNAICRIKLLLVYYMFFTGTLGVS
jgi:hypothetical protein